MTQMDAREINREVVARFRSGGELPDGMHRERLVLLTTTGARTGRERTTPMMFHADGDRLLVIASNAGATRHPAWYRNLVADPRVTVEAGDERYHALATPLTGDERERAWTAIKRAYPFFGDHEARAGRRIPVVALGRVEAGAPVIVTRAARPCVGITAQVTMQTIIAIVDRIPEVFGWLAARGVAPAGAPFLRFHVIDMARGLEIEAGVPVADVVEGDDTVRAGILPAGRYATALHVGHPDGLMAATAALLDWAAREGLRWDKTDADAGERWGCRLEIYHTDPAEVPDPARWETELAFRLAD